MIGVGFALQSKVHVPGPQPITLTDWASQIQRQGPEQAYQIFKQETAKENVEEQHIQAHAFGQALYEVQGVKGVTVCDSAFGFGCFHQFFLSAIMGEGLEIVPQLDEACIQKFGLGGQGCQHGIGHGLVEYFSHDLSQALNVCAKMKWQKPLFGCQSGVFMEYNFPTFVDENGGRRQSRQFDKTQPFSPCFEIPDRFHLSCVYAQAEWWDKGLSLNYSEMGEYCRTLTESDLRQICFIGIGVSAVSAGNFETEAVLQACGEMSGEAAQISCRGGGYWGFFDAGANFHEQAKILCNKGLREKQRNQCVLEGSLQNL